MVGFDGKALDYDDWYETPLGAFVDARETECAFSLLPPDMGKKVLDAGCGTGNFSLKLSLLGYEVTGIDLSQKMLAVAEAKAKHAGLDLSFHRMDLCDLKMADGAFDAVISMALFEFIHDTEKALRECFRVVRPGGYVMVGTITADSSWGKAYRQQMAREDSVFHNAAFKTTDEMRRFFPEWRIKDRESVFIPPDVALERLHLAEECRLSKEATGAFICLLWQKPLA